VEGSGDVAEFKSRNHSWSDWQTWESPDKKKLSCMGILAEAKDTTELG